MNRNDRPRAHLPIDGALLVGRAGAGIVMLSTPRLVSRLWLGRHDADAAALVRLVGIRDLILCAGQAGALPGSSGRWRRLGAIADVADGVIALATARRLHQRTSVAIAASAFGAAAWTLLAGDDHQTSEG